MLILIAVFSFNGNAFADSLALKKFSNTASDRYRDSGQDSNSVSTLYSFENIYKAYVGSNYNFAEITTKVELKKAFQECVFYTKGAYGEHLSNTVSKNLADEYTNLLHGSIAIKALQRIEPNDNNENLTDDESAVFNAPCALGVIDVDGDTVIMQGISID